MISLQCVNCGDVNPGFMLEHENSGWWCMDCISKWGGRARALGLLQMPVELVKLREAAKKLIAAEHKFMADTGMQWSDDVTEAVKELEALL